MYANVTLLKVKTNEMEERQNIMILERNKEFSINTSTNPTNVAKGYKDGTL